jgi:hypothetical protein
VTLDGPELTNESTFTGDEGTTYTVSNVHFASGGGGGHGGGGGSMTGDLTWTNSSWHYTATVENGSTVTRDNTTYLVTTDNESEQMTLTAEQNVSALLRANESVENTLVTQNGTEYVKYRSDNRIEPLSQWLPEPDTRTYLVGAPFTYQSDTGPQQTNITAISDSGATVEWVAPKDRSVELAEGGNVTLADGTYFAHFPDHSTVQVVSVEQYDDYQNTLSDQAYFHERKNGFWGVSILSGIAAVLMLGMAYLPNRG